MCFHFACFHVQIQVGHRHCPRRHLGCVSGSSITYGVLRRGVQEAAVRGALAKSRSIPSLQGQSLCLLLPDPARHHLSMLREHGRRTLERRRGVCQPVHDGRAAQTTHATKSGANGDGPDPVLLNLLAAVPHPQPDGVLGARVRDGVQLLLGDHLPVDGVREQLPQPAPLLVSL